MNIKNNCQVAIGNQTAFSAAALLEPFEYALASGFTAFEWFPDKKPSGAGWDSSDLDNAMRAEIRQRAADRGLRLSVHAHWTANPLHSDAIPGLRRDLDLAESLGAALLNLHLYTEAGIPAYARAVVPLLEQAASRGLQVSIENTPETTPQHFNEFFSELSEIAPLAALPAGLCFDIGHANLCSATRNDFLAYFDQLDPHVPIIHLHAHENWGDADTHLPLFTGPSAFEARGIEGLVRRLCRRGYAGSIILEQWPQPPSLLNAARDRLKEMLESEGLRGLDGDSSPSAEGKIGPDGQRLAAAGQSS